MLERIPVVFGFKIAHGYLYETIDLVGPEEVTGRLSPGQRVVLYQDDRKEVEATALFDAASRAWTFEPDEATVRELPYRKKGYGPWRILANGEPIGEFNAPRTYDSMGMTYGPFTPCPAYATLGPVWRLLAGLDVPQRFLDWTADAERRERQWDALNLSIVTRDERPVPVNWVRITEAEELKELGDDYAHYVEVNVNYRVFQDDHYWIDDAS